MVGYNIYSRVFIFASFLVFLFAGVYAIDDLMALQGNVLQNGANLNSGNLTVYIFDAYSGGNVIYNSSSDFANSISAGKYDVMLGNSSQTLSLEYGKYYYMEIYINTEKLSFNGSSRQIFQSSVGNISLSQLSGGGTIVLNNQSVTWADGQNVSTGSGGWFKGLFNWIIGSASLTYLTFNGTTLNLTESLTKWLYNQTYSGATFNATYDGLIQWGYNQTAGAKTYADTTFLRKDGDNGTGTYNFNNGWTNGGVSITSGNLFAQALYVYNITSLSVNNLDINGSLSPVDFDNTFNLGNATWRWKNGYFGTDVYVDGVAFSGLVSNASYLSTFNATYNALNSTYGIWWYNQSNASITYLNTTYGKFWYNMTSALGGPANNPFDQILNTTSNVQFKNLTATQKVLIGGTVFDNNATLNVRDGATNVYLTSTLFTGSVNLSFRSEVAGRIFGDNWVIGSKITNGGGAVTDYQIGDLIFYGRRTVFSNNTEEVLRLAASGNVGINISSPTQQLHINGAGGNAHGIRITDVTTNKDFLIRGDGSNFVVGTEDLNNFTFWTNSLQRAVITSEGKVGVGILYPTASLHLNSSASTGAFYIQNTSDYNILFINGTNGRVGIGTIAPTSLLHISGSGALLNVSNVSNSFLFATQSNGGQVGIGTQTPASTSKLEVAGNVNITGTNNLTIGGGLIYWDATDSKLVIKVS